MNRPELLDHDATFAMLFTSSSQALKRFPWLDEMIVGANTIPEGWQRVATTDMLGLPHWLGIAGDPHGPLLPIPTRYRKTETVAVQKYAMETARNTFADPRDGVLLHFGAQIVVGAMAEGQRFADRADLFSVTHELIQLRVGRGDVGASACVFSPEQQQVVPVRGEILPYMFTQPHQAPIPVL